MSLEDIPGDQESPIKDGKRDLTPPKYLSSLKNPNNFKVPDRGYDKDWKDLKDKDGPNEDNYALKA